MVAPTTRTGTPRSKRVDLLALALGAALLAAALSFDWVHLLSIVRFPAGEMNNRWVRVDLITLRALCAVAGTLIVLSAVTLRTRPEVFAGWSRRLESLRAAAARSRMTAPLLLAVLVLTKTVLQLGLYFGGYTVYAADDFSRSLSADYWLQYHKFDLGSEGFLGLSGSGWLPLSDYLFGLGLALHRDLFLTPKVINLVISGVLVVALYFLGRELFGRFVGVLTAAVFAFQPWHVWIGISGMTSDLPSVLAIVLFGMCLFRWLRSGSDAALLAAAAFLGVANGFRYENWFFTVVFSVLVLLLTARRWKHARLSPRSAAATACALVMVCAIPVAWMTASYLVFGDWLPALRTNVSNYYDVAFSTSSVTAKPMISLPLLAVGSFPFEIALSIAGIASFFVLDRRRFVRWYMVVPLAALALFAVVVRDRLPAYLMCARYFLPYVALLLPFAGFLIARLAFARQPWTSEAMALAGLILVSLGLMDVGRAFNYPAMFPQDAILAGRLIRGLQETGELPANGKVLIERAADWGDLGIVALANRPERFVALNEFAFRHTLPRLRWAEPTVAPPAETDNVRGSACNKGFQVEACRRSVLRERFQLVILSSPEKAESFQGAFHPPTWTVGRYRIFEMETLPGAERSTRLESANAQTVRR